MNRSDESLHEPWVTGLARRERSLLCNDLAVLKSGLQSRFTHRQIALLSADIAQIDETISDYGRRQISRF